MIQTAFHYFDVAWKWQGLCTVTPPEAANHAYSAINAHHSDSIRYYLCSTILSPPSQAHPDYHQACAHDIIGRYRSVKKCGS